MGIIDFVRDRALYFIIGLALTAGLLGAYGRERHEGRSPNGNWWLSRILLLPFLAIVSSATVDQLALNSQQAALLASILSLMGYEAVALIIGYVRRKAGAPPEVVAADTPASPRPYASLIDTDEAGRPTAHVMLTPNGGSRKAAIGNAVKDSVPLVRDSDAEERRLLDKLDDIDL